MCICTCIYGNECRFVFRHLRLSQECVQVQESNAGVYFALFFHTSRLRYGVILHAIIDKITAVKRKVQYTR